MTTDESLRADLAAAHCKIASLEAQLARQAMEPRSAAELLETAVAHAPIVLWCTDRDGYFTLSEGRGLTPLGLKPGQAVGLSAFEMYADNAQIIASLHRALRGEESVTRAEVSGLVYESWTAPLRDEEGQIIGVIGVATDITANARAEATESQFRTRFQRVFERSAAGIMLTDFETGRLIDVNPAFCELLERSAEELLGRTTVEIGFWIDADQRRSVLSSADKVGSAPAHQHRLRTALGQTRIVECRGDALVIDGRECLLTVVHDVTATHRYAEMLRRSRRRLRMLTRFAPVGIFRCTEAGRIVDSNQQLERMWEQDASSLMVNEWWSLICPDDRAEVARQWRIAVYQQTAFSAEFRVITTNGEIRWYFAQSDAPGKAGGIVLTATDITARKLGEQALQQLNEELEARVAQRTSLLVNTNQTLEEQIFERRKAADELAASNEKWRSLVEGAPDLIMLVNRDYQITFMNHTVDPAERQVKEVVGNSVFDFIFPEFHDHVRRDLDRVFHDGESVAHEVAGPSPNGERLWFQSHIAPIWLDDEVIEATVVCRDITQQRRATDELKLKQDQLTHVARVSMVGEMTAAIAHELFQPLMAVSNYVGGCIIRLQRNEPATADVLETLQDAVDQSHRASEIIRRMRQFLQHNELKQEMVSVRELYTDVQKLSEPAVRRGRVVCQVEFPTPDRKVHVDRIQIVQVLLNLVLNAVESLEETTEQSREIRVCSACPKPGWLEMMVQDNGPGLPEKLGDQIFEAFVTTKKDGLGLGLSISRSIVEGHGGTMRTRRVGDRGVTFVVRLPLGNH